jgi:hypothetical protein
LTGLDSLLDWLSSPSSHRWRGNLPRRPWESGRATGCFIANIFQPAPAFFCGFCEFLRLTPFLISCRLSKFDQAETKPLKLGHKNSQKTQNENGKGDLVTGPPGLTSHALRFPKRLQMSNPRGIGLQRQRRGIVVDHISQIEIFSPVGPASSRVTRNPLFL